VSNPKTPAPPQPAELPKPLTDAALRRRVAIIDGWTELDDTPYGLWGLPPAGSEPLPVPHYESDLNAAEGAVRRWCESPAIGWKLCEDWLSAGRGPEWCIKCEIGDRFRVAVPASHPHAAARAMCLCLVAADDALKGKV
jgi:hypothetical protein